MLFGRGSQLRNENTVVKLPVDVNNVSKLPGSRGFDIFFFILFWGLRLSLAPPWRRVWMAVLGLECDQAEIGAAERVCFNGLSWHFKGQFRNSVSRSKCCFPGGLWVPGAARQRC